MHSTTKRRLASPVIALVALATFAGVASAAPSTTLTKFGDGDVTITSNGATLANGADEYSGVYLKSKSQSNKPLADVDFSFDYEGDTAGGAPRLSIPLNTRARISMRSSTPSTAGRPVPSARATPTAASSSTSAVSRSTTGMTLRTPIRIGGSPRARSRS